MIIPVLSRLSAALFVLAVLAALSTSPFAFGESAAPLRAGFGVAEITPPAPNFRMSGYFSERINTGAHDPLLAKAMLLEQGDIRVAVVLCDLIGVIREVSDAARAGISEAVGVPVEHCVVAATHTHTGPLYYGVFQEIFSARESEIPYPDVKAYTAFLIAQIIAAAVEAEQKLQPVELRHGVALEHARSFNRRFYMRDGTVRFNPGRLNPNAIQAVGPVDPEVGLVSFHPAQGDRPLAVFTVFSLHLDTVGGLDFSADYPYHLQEGLRGALGGDVVSLFGLGPCGDVNHVDVSQNLPQKGQEEAGRIGNHLAATVLEGLAGMKAPAVPALAAARTTVEAPLQSYSPEDLAWAREMFPRIEDSDFPFLDRVKVRRTLDLAAREGDSITLEAQAVRLSEEAALVFLPGEIFVELGLALKAASPFRHTLVVELANDNPAYIPTAKAFAEGSYEVENSRIEGGGGEVLIEAARRLLYQLKFAE